MCDYKIVKIIQAPNYFRYQSLKYLDNDNNHLGFDIKVRLNHKI